MLLERAGDAAYKQLDAQSEFSSLYEEPGMTPFPDTFTLKWLQAELMREANRQRLYGTLPTIRSCTNAWMKKPEVKEVLTGVQARGTEDGFFYNSFIIQYGVEDKLLFSNDMFAFYKQLKSSQRPVCLVNGGIPAPTAEEISAIKRQNYSDADQLAAGLSRNIQVSASAELQRLMVKTFIDLVLEEAKTCGGTLSQADQQGSLFAGLAEAVSKRIVFQLEDAG